jgi:uncharacterized protein (TIGR02147 family)
MAEAHALAEAQSMETMLIDTKNQVPLPPFNWTKNRPFGSPYLEAPDPMTVFEFDDFRAYLNYVLSHYPGLRKPITLERWAKKLNYRSPRSIAMVLKGQRLPSEDLVLAFSNDLKHTENERRYFELLVRKEKYRGNIPKVILDELQKLNPRLLRRRALDTELFSYVSGWHHYVIGQLFQAPGYSDDPEWIVGRLGGKLTVEDVKASLQLLEKLQILDRDQTTGRLRLSAIDPLITMEDIPSAAVRKHHVEQMDQARDALQTQPMMEREFTCLTMRVNREKLPEVKKMIREFRDKFDKDYFDEKSEDVCQLNLQFFFHTVEGKK